jgi:uncharacterized protein (DUF849 family)
MQTIFDDAIQMNNIGASIAHVHFI